MEKDLRLKVLNLKDVQRELDTEKMVSSKVYNEVGLASDIHCTEIAAAILTYYSGYTPVIMSLLIIPGPLPSTGAWQGEGCPYETNEGGAGERGPASQE